MSVSPSSNGIALIAVCSVAIVGPILICVAMDQPLWIGTVVGIVIAAPIALLAARQWDIGLVQPDAASDCPYCERGETWTTKNIHRRETDKIKQRVLADPAYAVSDDGDGTPLWLAIAHGELDLVNYILQHSAGPTAEPDGGAACLMAAISLEQPCSVEILSKLVTAGVSVCFNGYGGWLCTPLHWAADAGDVDKARILLDAGANVNERTEDIDGDTPLIKAASKGRLEMVRFLLERGADPKLQDACGANALAHARNAADLTFLEKVQTTLADIHEKALQSLTDGSFKSNRSMLKNIQQQYEKDREENRRQALELATSDRLQEVIRVLTEVTPHTT
jgi:ankyrin repeat protein